MADTITIPSSTGLPNRQKVELPELAAYKPISSYVPKYGDYIVWSGWLSTWHGFITNYDQDGYVHVIFSGLPMLLVTMDPEEQAKETRKVLLSKIKQSVGEFAVLSSEKAQQVWYV